ncbi:phage tail protein I [Wohlfahrtiimonas chitiniclastica]|nr:phage tail protein I [Wohlfahrtiimonas chitiniclastica]
MMVVSMRPHELLPTSSTQLERDLADVCALSMHDFSYAALNSAEDCPTELLGWLAWSRSIEDWDESWPEDRKRKMIREAPAISLQAGTVASMRRAMRSVGFGEIEFIRRGKRQQHDGLFKHNGRIRYAKQTTMTWAQYIVAFQSPLTTDQMEMAKSILNATAPARCELLDVQYARPMKHDKTFKHNGTYRYGVR